MRNFTYNGKNYQVDAQGFLVDPKEWDENFAEGMALKVQIPGGLTPAHWKIIHFIRNTFDKMNVCPLVYIACKKNHLGLGELRGLFPRGYLRGACKLAGVTYREAWFQETWLEENIVHHTRAYETKKYPVDEQGFLTEPAAWDENFSLQTAYKTGMTDLLNKRQWDIIYYLRGKYSDTGEVPTVYTTCEDNGFSLDDLEKLFPQGYHRGAVRLAGLRAH